MQQLITVLGWVLIILLIGILFAIPVMLLWNACLVPAVAGISEIGLLQAWGINILCSFLFNFNVNNSN